MNSKYVKFSRGTPEAYKNLGTKNPDTLYFIYEEDDAIGNLYLGDKLIANAGEEGATNLQDLLDVDIADLKESDVLTYDSGSGKWKNVQVTDIIPEFVGTNGVSEGIAGLVPAPGAGTSTRVLRSDGTWVEPEKPILPGGDELSISLNDTETQYSLKNFGVQYYAYNAEEDRYDLQVVDAGHPWKAGLEPRVALEGGHLVLAWYEPNFTTIDGINSQIGSLQTNVDSLTAVVNTKANSADVYTKTETDANIAKAVSEADHLKRVKVDSVESIDPTAENADQYIYMAPSGLEEDDNKYYEYIVIDGKVEPVGSWEVDLSGYAKTAEVTAALDLKVDKAVDSRLMTEAEGAKLAGIAEGAQVNIIDAVDGTYFEISTDGKKQLTLKDISASKVTDLSDLLDKKVDKVEGSRLITNEEVVKLESLANIKTVDTNHFVLSAEGQLGLNADLLALINGKANASDVTDLTTRVGNLESQVEESMVWGELV